MLQMSQLTVSSNALSGTLPSSWANLTKVCKALFTLQMTARCFVTSMYLGKA